MRLTGEREFESSRTAVWEHLLEAELLEACIPGATRVERVGDGVYEGEVNRTLASIRVVMDLGVAIESDDRPEAVSIDIDGTDARTGSHVSGGGRFELERTDGGSTLSYDVALTVTGRLASLGPRFVKRQLASDLDAFFECARARIDD